MPVLRGFNPGIDHALARMAEVARDEETFWQAEVARVLPQLVLPGRPVRGGGRAVSTSAQQRECAVEIARLAALPAALGRRVIRALAADVAPGMVLQAEETAKVMALAGLSGRGLRRAGVVTGRIGSRLELHDGLRVERSARELRFYLHNG